MFIAQNAVTKINTYIDDAIHSNEQYICPICGEKVIIKNGSLVTPHFAHVSTSNCDTFNYDISEWHKWWQEQFPKGNREHVEEMEFDINDWGWISACHGFSGRKLRKFQSEKPEKILLKHRADVRACGYIIEFQNSPISREEFNERNWFYTSIGCKVIWIFNMIDRYDNCSIDCYDETNSKYGGGKYIWKFPIKTFSNFVPQLDTKENNIYLFFQFAEFDEDIPDGPILEQVIWAIEKDCGGSDFRRFITTYRITSLGEFIDAIKNRKL